VLDGEGVPFDAVATPDIYFAIVVPIYLERAVGFDCPHRPEGVNPRAGKRRWASGRRSCARVQNHEADGGDKESQMYFHALMLFGHGRSSGRIAAEL